MDEGDSKGHNEGLGFEFKYTVRNRIKPYNCQRVDGCISSEG